MRFLLTALLAFTCCVHAQVARAEYPDRPITLVVPFAAGGPTDAIARLLAQQMSVELKQSFVIENVSGVGGALGSARVAKASGDGYTLLINDLALPSAPLLKRTTPFNVSTDFVPIGVLNTGPMVLIARSSIGFASMQELIARLKTGPTPLNLGHSGIGSNSHMCGLLLQSATGVKVTEVAYRGAAPAMNDLVAGTLDIMCEQTATAIPQIEGGAVSPLAVTAPERLASLPKVPTMAEAGLSGFVFELWHGLYAPKGTPDEVVRRLNTALNASLDAPAVAKRYAEMGRSPLAPTLRTPEAHRERLKAEATRLRALLEGAGVKPQD